MDDLISRQAAIEALKEHRALFCDNTPDTFSKLSYAEKSRVDELDMAIATLINLPSAQPEIIRCTECKHYREYDSEYVANAVVVQCMADRYPISETIPDGWFCAGAERKDDE